MSIRGGEQLSILNIPNLGISPTRQVRHKLTEPPVGIPITECRNLLQQFLPLG
jgi:hypothetical protein